MKLRAKDLVMLDAEDLAEGGIREAYDKLVPRLQKLLGKTPEPVEERMSDSDPSYHVRFRNQEYRVYSGDQNEDSWERATSVLFLVVNRQLARSDVKFYAMSGGNDLTGMFLTPAQAEDLISSMSLSEEFAPHPPKVIRPEKR